MIQIGKDENENMEKYLIEQEEENLFCELIIRSKVRKARL